MSSLADAYQFLELEQWLEKSKGEPHQHAYWLLSDFDSNHWVCDFGHKKAHIKFDVYLEDGSLLTHQKNRDLLNVFKSWLCIQTHPTVLGGGSFSPNTLYNRVSRTLHLIDYILVRANDLRPGERGVSLFGGSLFKSMLTDLASSNFISQSVYCWPRLLPRYLTQEIPASNFRKPPPDILIVDDDDELQMFDLSGKEIVEIRLRLWALGCYKGGSGTSYRHVPSTEKIAGLLYANTLWGGRTQLRLPRELCFSPLERIDREYPAVSSRSDVREGCGEKLLSSYKAIISTLEVLKPLGLIPRSAPTSDFATRAFMASLKPKAIGRFRTLPQSLVLRCLRNAMEFYLEYGQELIDSFLNLSLAAAEVRQSPFCFSYGKDIAPYMTEKIRLLGVCHWTVAEEDVRVDRRKRRDAPANYFVRFRKNEGLWELLQVLYGSIAIAIGALSARRFGELVELPVKCTDKFGNLIFRNRKSGVSGHRPNYRRPLPSIAVDMIETLGSFQDRLISLNLIPHRSTLFAPPSFSGDFLRVSDCSFNVSVDYFSDYFQTDVTPNGRRYYPRQHQLRRAFAMMFFWSNSFGGMETLRWFLGHTDIEHLYRYITEDIPGAVLVSLKADYAIQKVMSSSVEGSGLPDLLAEKYNTRNFSVLDSEELQLYVEELITDGKLMVEPEFFTGPNGQWFQVLILVKQKAE